MTQLPEVHRTGGLIGAEIRGLDLTREYPDETYAAVRQAWAEHGVIFFRDQHLTAEQRQALAQSPRRVSRSRTGVRGGSADAVAASSAGAAGGGGVQPGLSLVGPG